MSKLDPVTGEIISIRSMAKGIFKVESTDNKWYALKLFTDTEDALDWRSDFDLFKGVASAKEDKDPKSGLVRLLGKNWATEFMGEADLELWKADVEAAKPKQKTRAKTKAKQVPADAPTTDS